MLDRLFATRHHVFMVILAAYFLPLSILILYGVSYLPAQAGWAVASMGLLTSTLGALTLFVSMHRWEARLLEATHGVDAFGVEEIDREEEQRVFALLEETKNRCQQLEELLEVEKSQLQLTEDLLEEQKGLLSAVTAEKEALLQRHELQTKEYEAFKSSADEKLEQNIIFVNAYQQTIQEQCISLENKQQQIAQLEGKVRDLTYEIKTLLQLAEKAESIAKQGVQDMLFSADSLTTPPLITDESHILGTKVSSDIAAMQQLRLCIKAAQKITGSGHYGNRLARMRDLSIDSYTLDLRHLTEGFNADDSCVILFYSAKENKPLYVNPQIKELLEWTAEKYLQNFSSIVQDCLEQWEEMLGQLTYKHEVLGRLLMKSKSGKVVTVQCALGVIPTGIFRGNYIGIFY